MIPISKPFFDNLEKKYLNQVLNSKILVDGHFQHKVEKIIVSNKCLPIFDLKFYISLHNHKKKIEIGDYLEDFKVYEYIKVVMTLTSVMCPFADEIIAQVESEVNLLNLGEAQVELDFTEAWEPSEELKMKLGINKNIKSLILVFTECIC